jgi:hypothetical protein
MTKSTEVRAGLVISGFDCDPDEISRVLNVVPSLVLRIGDPHGPRRSGRPVRENIWRFDSQVDEIVIVERHIEWLFDHLPTTFDSLRAVALRWEAQVTIAAHVRTLQGPSIAFSEETVQKLARWNASVDIDLYCRENAEED